LLGLSPVDILILWNLAGYPYPEAGLFVL
jgi:hypothetical protein